MLCSIIVLNNFRCPGATLLFKSIPKWLGNGLILLNVVFPVCPIHITSPTEMANQLERSAR